MGLAAFQTMVLAVEAAASCGGKTVSAVNRDDAAADAAGDSAGGDGGEHDGGERDGSDDARSEDSASLGDTSDRWRRTFSVRSASAATSARLQVVHGQGVTLAAIQALLARIEALEKQCAPEPAPRPPILVPWNRDSSPISSVLDAARRVASPRNTSSMSSARRLASDADASPISATNHGSRGLGE